MSQRQNDPLTDPITLPVDTAFADLPEPTSTAYKPEREAEWATEDSVPDPVGVMPVGFRLLIRPLSALKKTKAGIHLSDTTVEVQELLITVGKLLSVGPTAWCRSDHVDAEGKRVEWAKVGQYVIYGKYAGAKVKIGGVRCLFLNDDEIFGTISDPELLRTLR